MVATISVCLQIIVRYCPLKTIRDVYSKITLLLLNGSVLRLSETGDMEVPEWPSMSKALSESLIRRDDEAFSAEFRRMTEMHFVITKQKLLEIGIEGIETIVDPVKQEDQKVNSKE
ncbi:hypothetical protein [Clostridium sp. AM58-1XD]|uniref:hypothetical protein n=1 Tax=Clostridium sp. AM58-1XD TaxID=2292307 RepID=UPI000E4DC88A|nr:hypothetical protein [Clostridium sp. AM58-1XD]RGY95264.1 hypothetical protein DXA13_19540 [Clostridium sp. AM58-1XD]